MGLLSQLPAQKSADGEKGFVGLLSQLPAQKIAQKNAASED